MLEPSASTTTQIRGRKVRPRLAMLLLAILLPGLLMVPAADAQVTNRQLTEARERYRQVQSQLNRLAEQYARQQARLDEVQGQIAATNRAIRESNEEMSALQERLRSRVRMAYMTGGGIGTFDFLMSAGSFREFSLRAMMLERQSSEDEDLILTLRRSRAELNQREQALRSQRQAQAAELATIRRQAAQFDAAFNDARALLQRLEDNRRAEELARTRTRAAAASRTVASASGRVISLVRCPAAGPRAFSNDWGAPRGGGRRRHQGNDIFAPMGSPAVAVVPGVISRQSNGGNAGLAVYLWGDDGNRYFYAHMSGFAVPVGTRVSAGQTIAYVGNTGNARGTAPHIHFEVHPGGGRPINPYPSLIRVC